MTTASRILSELSAHEATVYELADLFCISSSTVRRAMHDLMRSGRVRPSGKRPQYGPCGRMQIVYAATP